MKKYLVVMGVILTIFSCSVNIFASDPEEMIMQNKNQDVLFVGKVSHTSKDYIVLKVTDYINVDLSDETIAKREEDHRYVVDKSGYISYRWSYHEKEILEEGDNVVASLKKDKQNWKIGNGIYEVDTDDYKNLSFEPFHNELSFKKTALKYFINSDGQMKSFSAKNNSREIYNNKTKIYDRRWKLKKYLTIEEIRNEEKLKAMDQKAHIRESRVLGSVSTGFKRKILFAIDMIVIIGMVAVLKKKSRNNKLKERK